MQAKDYDVFISCKSEDYIYAEEIYDYLVANGFNAFLASKELRKLGDSEYRKAITSALRSAYHLIIFASNAEYIESKWVYYEWDMFVNAKLNGFKDGNIFTILKDVPVREISMDLWKYESMTLDNYKDTLLGYVETPEHRAMAEKLEQERRLREKSEKERFELTKQLKKATEDFNTRQTILNTLERRKISVILHKLNITERSCPACGEAVALDDEYCRRCGLYLNPMDGIPELGAVSVTEPKRIVFHRDLSHKISQTDKLRAEKEELQQIIKFQEDKIKMLFTEIDALRQRSTPPASTDKSVEPKEMPHMGKTKIGKIARDLNLSVPAIIEFLRKNNIEIDEAPNPNTRIEGRAVELLIRAFQGDKDIKTQSAPAPQKIRILGKLELDKNGNPIVRSNKTSNE